MKVWACPAFKALALLLVGLCVTIPSGATAVAEECDDRSGSIHEAVKENNVDAVTCLLKAGADVNALDQTGLPALWEAVADRNLRLVRLLLEASADPNAGRSKPLFVVLLSELQGAKDIETVEAILTELIAHGADVNQVNSHGGEQLFNVLEHYAYELCVDLGLAGASHIVNTLIAAGAKPLPRTRHFFRVFRFMAEQRGPEHTRCVDNVLGYLPDK